MAIEFEIPEVLHAWLRQSVLAIGVDPFVFSLTSQNYQSSTIRGYVGAVAHMALWMTQERIALAQFDGVVDLRWTRQGHRHVLVSHGHPGTDAGRQHPLPEAGAGRPP